MRDAPMRHAKERVWFLSPALATAVFFALRLLLGAAEPAGFSDRVAGAAEPSVNIPSSVTHVRVVSEIRRVEKVHRQTRTVPDTEADLLRLLQQEGSVTFYSDEVEVVATSAPEFEPTRVQIATRDRSTYASESSHALRVAADP